MSNPLIGPYFLGGLAFGGCPWILIINDASTFLIRGAACECLKRHSFFAVHPEGRQFLCSSGEVFFCGPPINSPLRDMRDSLENMCSFAYWIEGNLKSLASVFGAILTHLAHHGTPDSMGQIRWPTAPLVFCRLYFSHGFEVSNLGHFGCSVAWGMKLDFRPPAKICIPNRSEGISHRLPPTLNVELLDVSLLFEYWNAGFGSHLHQHVGKLAAQVY